MNIVFGKDITRKDDRGREVRIAYLDGQQIAEIIPYRNGNGWQVIIKGKTDESLAPLVALGVSKTLPVAQETVGLVWQLVLLAREFAGEGSGDDIQMKMFKRMKDEKAHLAWPSNRLGDFLKAVNG